MTLIYLVPDLNVSLLSSKKNVTLCLAMSARQKDERKSEQDLKIKSDMYRYCVMQFQWAMHNIIQ